MALADEHDIKALPTFHFFRKSQKVDELQGADPKGLEQKIHEHQVKVKQWGGGVQLKDDSTHIYTGGVIRNANDPPPSIPSAGQSAEGNGTVLEPLLQNLVEMGFSENHSRQGLIATNNAGLEQALDW
jgi:thioredoxin-like negative regulator of GroEL